MVYAHILSPVLGLLVNTVTQFLVCRNFKSLGLLKSVIAGFGSGFLAVAGIEILYNILNKAPASEAFGQGATTILTYIALGYCYFHLINLGETARRIRLIREIGDSKDGLSLEELLMRYNARATVKARLQRMLNNKQIINIEGRYYIGKPLLLIMAKALVMMKVILLGKRSEFE